MTQVGSTDIALLNSPRAVLAKFVLEQAADLGSVRIVRGPCAHFWWFASERMLEKCSHVECLDFSSVLVKSVDCSRGVSQLCPCLRGHQMFTRNEIHQFGRLIRERA